MASIGFDDLLSIPTFGAYTAQKQLGGVDLSGGNSIGDTVNGVGKSRHSNYNAQGFDNSPYFDPNAFYFGGSPEQTGQYRDDAWGRGNAYGQMGDWYNQMGAMGQNRLTSENATLANRDAAARAQMVGANDLARQAAEGNAPSEAAYMMQRGLNNAISGQNSMAGSARGAAALAQAQTNGQANVANMQNQAFTNAGQLRAQEMANARNLYANTSNALRGMDQSRLQMGNQMGQFNRTANDQYQNSMGQLGLGYGQLGQGYYNTGVGIMGQDQQGRIGLQHMLDNDWNNANQINSGINLYNTNSDKEAQDQIAGFIKSMATSSLGWAGGGMGPK